MSKKLDKICCYLKFFIIILYTSFSLSIENILHLLCNI